MIHFKLKRLPPHNVRLEYRRYKKLLSDAAFRRSFIGDRGNEIHFGNFIWANIDEGTTVLLQRVILGFEATIPFHVTLELGCSGRLTKAVNEQLKDPMKIKCLGSKKRPGTADYYYDILPAFVASKHALSNSDPELWELVRTFYRDVRNNIFHGYIITNLSLNDLDFCFSVFDRIWVWLDTWCNIEKRLNEVGNGVIKIRIDGD